MKKMCAGVLLATTLSSVSLSATNPTYTLAPQDPGVGQWQSRSCWQKKTRGQKTCIITGITLAVSSVLGTLGGLVAWNRSSITNNGNRLDNIDAQLKAAEDACNEMGNEGFGFGNAANFITGCTSQLKENIQKLIQHGTDINKLASDVNAARATCQELYEKLLPFGVDNKGGWVFDDQSDSWFGPSTQSKKSFLSGCTDSISEKFGQVDFNIFTVQEQVKMLVDNLDTLEDKFNAQMQAFERAQKNITQAQEKLRNLQESQEKGKEEAKALQDAQTKILKISNTISEDQSDKLLATLKTQRAKDLVTTLIDARNEQIETVQRFTTQIESLQSQLNDADQGLSVSEAVNMILQTNSRLAALCQQMARCGDNAHCFFNAVMSYCTQEDSYGPAYVQFDQWANYVPPPSPDRGQGVWTGGQLTSSPGWHQDSSDNWYYKTNNGDILLCTQKTNEEGKEGFLAWRGRLDDNGAIDFVNDHQGDWVKANPNFMETLPIKEQCLPLHNGDDGGQVMPAGEQPSGSVPGTSMVTAQDVLSALQDPSSDAYQFISLFQALANNPDQHIKDSAAYKQMTAKIGQLNIESAVNYILNSCNIVSITDLNPADLFEAAAQIPSDSRIFDTFIYKRGDINIYSGVVNLLNHGYCPVKKN